jgi:type IV pilus assembly protein PilO
MKFGLKEFLFLPVLLAIPLASWWFVFDPQNKEIAQARIEIQQKQIKLNQFKDVKLFIPDLESHSARLASTVELFDAKLPAQKEVDVILKEVTQLASRHGLTTQSFRPDKQVEAERYTEHPLKMVISGNFDGYYSFLLDLERLRRITRIPNMKLKKLNGANEGQMEAEFTLSIYAESDKTTNTQGA